MSVRLCVAALLLLPAAAFAQSNPGPFGGLFGRTPERVGREYTALDFRASGVGQFNDAVLMPDSAPPDGVPQRGASSGVNANLMFDRFSDRVRVTARAGATYQEAYQRDPILGATGIDSSAMVVANVTTRLIVDASAAYRYSPFFQMEPVLAASTLVPAVEVPGYSYALRALDHESAEARASFTSQYSKRSSLSAYVSSRETWFTDPRNNYGAIGGGARWTRRLSRDVRLRLGYARDQIRTSSDTDDEFVHELLDIGLDLSRQLEIGPRTSMGFTASTVMVKEVAGAGAGERHFRFDGSVSVTKHFHRTWHASARFARHTQFMPGFFEPLFSNSLSTSIAGMFSRRTEWFAVLGASRGYFGFSQPQQAVTTGDATTRLSFALTRHLGAFGQYTYYYSDVGTGAATVPLIPKLSRQAITVGLTAWVPIINRVRTESDTR